MADSLQRIRVVAAVIKRDGGYLVCQRPLNKRHAGLWEFPGGKVHQGETDADALKRELREELSLDLDSCAAPLLEVDDPSSPFTIVFVPATVRGKAQLHEHIDLRWANADALVALPLAPADRRFVHEVLGGMGNTVPG